MACIRNLTSFYTGDVSFDTWDSSYKESQMKVEATVADDIQQSAGRRSGCSMLAIFVYIVLRFRRWQFGLGALVSLVHDAFTGSTFFPLFRTSCRFPWRSTKHLYSGIADCDRFPSTIPWWCLTVIRIPLKSCSGSIKDIFNAAINQTLS